MKTAYLWEKGECETNEDSLVLQQVETRVGTVTLAAVCDGVGGLKEGETASGYMAEMLIVWFYKELIPRVQRSKNKRKLYRSVLKMLLETDEKIKEYGRKKKIRLGTTVTMMIFIEKHFFLVHVGDSRVYQVKRKLRVLTKDDGNGKVLYRCIGAGKWEKPQWKHGKVRGKTGFLLCTDGFYKKLMKEEIIVVASPQCKEEVILEKRLKEAGERVKSRRMQDNVSAISLRPE